MPRRRVDPLSVGAHGEDRCQHREAGGVGGRHRHAAAGEPERRLDQPRPRQPPVPAPERVEARRKPWYSAGTRPDGVVDELLAERHLQRDGRRPLARGHVDEAIEAATPRSRPSGSHGRRREDRSSPSRRRTTRGRPQPPRRPPSRPPRGSRFRPPPWRDDPLRHRLGAWVATLVATEISAERAFLHAARGLRRTHREGGPWPSPRKSSRS